MNSICLFASYFNGNDLPYYITVYLKELKKHFKELVLITSQKDFSTISLNFLNVEGIKLQIEENKGFDFGLWYRALQQIDTSNYDQLILVNDSCVLFKPLDELMIWSAKDSSDFQGITSSEAISPHIQSYFLIFKKSAISNVLNYFEQHGVLEKISDVIQTYEVGLSTYLLSKGLKMSSYIDNNGYTGEFSPYYQCIDYHLLNGIPVIKKKILFASYRPDELFTLARMNFNIDEKYYIHQITSITKNLILDFALLKNLEDNSLSGFQKIKYRVYSLVIFLLKPLYKRIK